MFNSEDRIEFHQIIGLLKNHLHEPRPTQFIFEITQGPEKKEARFFDMAVNVHSTRFKKALKFLIDHNYTFSENDSKVPSAKAGPLRKREAKCDQKIAQSIEKMSRCHYQMEFYESMHQDVRKHIQNKIIEQNSYLRML